MVLVTYDVSTETEEGRRRLRQVAKRCQSYGQRVQNSVFECIIDSAQMVKLKSQLEGIIDPDVDSLRYYYLGNDWRNRVEHVGAKATVDLEGPLIL
jgi:CRISPR-associated protein Cas2